MKSPSLILIILFIIIFILSILSGTVAIIDTDDNYSNVSFTNEDNIIISYFSSNIFKWPSPGYTRITSPFGQRNAPTAGASSFHYGIDIGAPQGANVIASISGTVIYADFNGANGYTIKIKNGEHTIGYSHMSPYFLVNIGEYVCQGQIIGTVGPLYIDTVPNNPYKDSSGRSTNGATTGCHLHFSIMKNNTYINPLELLVEN